MSLLPTEPLKLEKIRTRFLTFVNKTDNCWEWIGTKALGYGRFAIGYKKHAAHRISYMLFKGEIPEKFHIDHLCKNKSCVNPEHLEAVTHRENTIRANSPIAINAKKTHCSRGHEFTIENTGKQASGRGRVCLICRKLTNEKYHNDNRERKNAQDRAYYQAHKEERKAKQKAYYWSEKAKGRIH